jgi:hypothetical protein
MTSHPRRRDHQRQISLSKSFVQDVGWPITEVKVIILYALTIVSSAQGISEGGLRIKLTYT